jgi:hypothetical protein
VFLRSQVPVGGKHTLLASDALSILPLSGLQNRTGRAAAAATTTTAVDALPNCLSLRAHVILLRVPGQAPTLAWWANRKKRNWCFGAVRACFDVIQGETQNF